MIGVIAGFVFMTWSFVMEKMKIDDPLDAVAGTIMKVNRNHVIYVLVASYLL